MTKKSGGGGKRKIEQYAHQGKKRANNPPVGLVTPRSDPDQPTQRYGYDPHLDPQLIWAGKAEHTSFEVPTVSLHVHERIDPRSIVEAVRKRNGNGNGSGEEQLSFFEGPEENPPLREAIEFYKHAHGWTNRMVAGDSLLVMNSLLEKEGMAGKVQMVYIDPPYGIRYGSNFQPFVNQRDVKEGKDDDLTQEPEMIKAFRDTWELGIHSYLAYLRDRVLLARELLHESGSCFVQISDENLHHVREVMDEVFGSANFVSVISIRKTTSQGTATLLGATTDFIVWYARDRGLAKYRQLYIPRSDVAEDRYDQALLSDGSVLAASRLRKCAAHSNARLFQVDNLTSSRPSGEGDVREFEYEGTKYTPGKGTFKTNRDGLQRLAQADRLQVTTNGGLRYRRFQDDFPLAAIGNLWTDISGAVQSRSDPKVYVVQSSTEIVARCMLMTTDPGDLVFDPTCGSGTTAYVAEQWGRRWITCDTSRVALTLAKQRLMTALFDYYRLAHPAEGVDSGFLYRTVPHVTLKSIANNPEIREGMTRAEIDRAIARYADQETLYDQPEADRSKARVSGPFTVEAVPAPAVRPIAEIVTEARPVSLADQAALPGLENLDLQERIEFTEDVSVARYGETVRQRQWRDELLACGIRGKGGQRIEFARLEPLGATRWLQCEGEIKPSPSGRGGKDPHPGPPPEGEGGKCPHRGPLQEGEGETRSERAVVSFGPEHAPLEQRQVELALEEAGTLRPAPKLLVFAAFQFDPEAAKDIDATNWPGVTLLKVQMNTDLLTDDLKKKRASNESYWLMGQPDVAVIREQWIVHSGKGLVPYDVLAKLSGVDSLAEINGLDRDDLSSFIAIAERRDLWAAIATDQGGRVDSGKHRGRAGEARHRGVPALPGRGPGLPGRIGDAADFVRELEAVPQRERGKHLDRLRRSREIADRAREIAATLTGQLSTIHYSQVTVHGFDYYNPRTGRIESGDTTKIAMWMLDTDYDGRSLYPRQVFFPMSGEKDGWSRLARNLKAEIDDELIEAYRGTVSLPFEPGPYQRVAVKIVDDRGIESLKIVPVEEHT